MEPHGPGETETDYPRSFNSAPRLMRPRGYIRGRGQIETYEPRGATARRKRRWDRRAGGGGGGWSGGMGAEEEKAFLLMRGTVGILVQSSPLTPSLASVEAVRILESLAS